MFDEHKGRYGGLRVHRELRHRGETIREKKVARILREDGLVARKKKRFHATTDSKHDGPIAPNLLARDFTAKGPNTIWATDVTAIWTYTGWLFLAAIIDLFSRRIVGWATSANNDRFLALDALRSALVARRPVAGLVLHSDRGSPYASDDYRRELHRAGVVASMSRKGDCWDSETLTVCYGTAA